MADGRHLEKSSSGYIYATVWPTAANFGMLMHIGPPHFADILNFELLQI